MDTSVDLGLDDPSFLDGFGDDVLVTEALRALRRSALRCRRARLLLDTEPDLVLGNAPVAS